jgi:hypothetical protein
MEPTVETGPPGVDAAASRSPRIDGRLLAAIAAPTIPVLAFALLKPGAPLGDLIFFPAYTGLAAIAPWIAGRWRMRVIVVNAAIGAVLWLAAFGLRNASACESEPSPLAGLIAFLVASTGVFALESALGAWIAGSGRALRGFVAFAVGIALAAPVYFLMLISSFNLGGPPLLFLAECPSPPGGAAGLQAVVVTRAGQGTDELLVEIVTGDGQRRTMAILPLGPDAASLTIRRALVSPDVDHLALWTQVPDPETSFHYGPFLLYDLIDPSKSPVVLPAGPAAPWGPGGRLLLSDEAGQFTVYDVAKATTTAIVVPEGITVADWAADGSGLLAARYGSDGATTLGVLREDGAFVPGPVQQYLPAGAARGIGANGEVMGIGHGDPAPGGIGYEFVSVRPPGSPGGEDSVLWYQAAFDVDPSPIAYTFDRAGTGIWLLLDAGAELRLAHLAQPQVVEVRVRLGDPFEGEVPTDEHQLATLDIVAISPNQSVVLLQQRAENIEEAADVYWLDLASGSTTTLAGWFAGWVGGSD